jgi:hypothetical protein
MSSEFDIKHFTIAFLVLKEALWEVARKPRHTHVRQCGSRGVPEVSFLKTPDSHKDKTGSSQSGIVKFGESVAVNHPAILMYDAADLEAYLR